MLPQFPEFAPIDFEFQNDIEAMVRRYEPNSDYNFLSLWCWDVESGRRVSELQGHLVVRFTDYITGAPFYSYLAGENSSLISDVLFRYLKESNEPTVLKLVPESAAFPLSSSDRYAVGVDTDNNDYILSVDELINLTGRKFDPKRNFINRFRRAYGARAAVVSLDLPDAKTQFDIERVFSDWEKAGSHASADTKAERMALGRLLANAGAFNVGGIGVSIDGRLAAFSIMEVGHDGYGFIQFEKADTSYVGIFPFLKREAAVWFAKAGCRYINYEQDLGIEGLRKAKRSYHPVFMLKKYTVSLRERKAVY